MWCLARSSTMLIAYSLLEFNVNNRKIYLYDTFEGMSQPTEFDYLLANSFCFRIASKEPKKILFLVFCNLKRS